MQSVNWLHALHFKYIDLEIKGSKCVKNGVMIDKRNNLYFQDKVLFYQYS
jgi:hypothetical protein